MTTQEFNVVSGILRRSRHRLDPHSERSLPMTFLNCADLLQDLERKIKRYKRQNSEDLNPADQLPDFWGKQTQFLRKGDADQLFDSLKKPNPDFANIGAYLMCYQTSAIHVYLSRKIPFRDCKTFKSLNFD